MKYLLTLIVFLMFIPQETLAQKTWEGYYVEFSHKDDFFGQELFIFPKPSGRQRSWNELSPKARRAAKSHMRTFYGVRPSTGGYIWGAIATTGRSIGRVVVYVAVTATAAVIVGAIINQPAESF